MIGPYREFSTQEVGPEMLREGDNSQQFSAGDAVSSLGFTQGPASISNHPLSPFLVTLSQYRPNAHITRICIENKRTTVVRIGQDRGRGKLLLQQLKGVLTVGGPLEGGVSLGETVQWLRDLGKLMDEASVVARESKKSYFLGRCRFALCRFSQGL